MVNSDWPRLYINFLLITQDFSLLSSKGQLALAPKKILLAEQKI
jgi:hypothetical protein